MTMAASFGQDAILDISKTPPRNMTGYLQNSPTKHDTTQQQQPEYTQRNTINTHHDMNTQQTTCETILNHPDMSQPEQTQDQRICADSVIEP